MRTQGAHSEACVRIGVRRLALLAAAEPETALTAALRAQRPRTRGECANGPRPCPWVSCRYHLYLDVTHDGTTIKHNFPDLEPWELRHTCALDVADNGGTNFEKVGVLMNLTRERIRQFEVTTLARIVDPMRGHADAGADASELLSAAESLKAGLLKLRESHARKRKKKGQEP